MNKGLLVGVRFVVRCGLGKVYLHRTIYGNTLPIGFCHFANVNYSILYI